MVATDDLVDQQELLAAAKAASSDGEANLQTVIDRAEKALAEDRERIAAAREAMAVATPWAADALVAAGLEVAVDHEDVLHIIRHVRL